MKILKEKEESNFELEKSKALYQILKHPKLTNKELANLCKKSERTIRRYKKEMLGKEKIIVKHKGRENKNRVKYSEEEIIALATIYKKFTNYYYPKNATINMPPLFYFFDKVARYLSKISYTNLFKRLKKRGFSNCQMTRKSKIRATRLLNKSENKEEDKLVVFAKINELRIDSDIKKTKKVYQAKKKKLKYGEFVEIDACQDVFYGNEKVFIYHAIDSGTGTLLGVHCEKQETNVGYHKLLDRLFKEHGFPRTIVTDRRRTFWGTEQTYTMFQKALYDRGINLITSSNPTDKPNVERSFRNIQNTIPVTLKDNNVNSIESFNKNKKAIINEYNRYYKKGQGKKASKFIENKIGNENYDFNLKIQRKIINNTVHYKNKIFAPYNEAGKRILFFENLGEEMNLYLDVNQELFFNIRGIKYMAKEVGKDELSEYELMLLDKGWDISVPHLNAISKAIYQSRSFIRQFSLVKNISAEVLKTKDVQKMIEIISKNQDILLKIFNLIENDLKWKDKIFEIEEE